MQLTKSPKSRKKSPTQRRLSILERWFKNSWLIVGARIADISGFSAAVIGALDWSPLLNSSGMSREQLVVTGVVIVLMGISHEAALRTKLNA